MVADAAWGMAWGFDDSELRLAELDVLAVGDVVGYVEGLGCRELKEAADLGVVGEEVVVGLM